jgi:hypothetical protein
MARIHLQAGDKTQIAGVGDMPIIITGWLVDTNGDNDATLKINDANGPVIPNSGFTVTGLRDSGGVSGFSIDELRLPVVAELTGAGSNAMIYFIRVR